MGNLDLVTIIIIAANVIISYKGFSDYAFFDTYKFSIGGVQRGEKIRMFSSGFLHVDTQHLLFNMLTLYFFCRYSYLLCTAYWIHNYLYYESSCRKFTVIIFS